jgi:hypothetical protein
MIFRQDKNHSAAVLALTPGQRAAYFAFATGGILPIVFLGIARPVFWLVAVQLACISGLAYIRWRSAAFRGSLIVLCAAVIACITSVVAAVAA